MVGAVSENEPGTADWGSAGVCVRRPSRGPSLWSGFVSFRSSYASWVASPGASPGAAAVGLTMPFLLRLLKRDLQVAARPIALAAADMLTLLVYFNLARWSLG